jgi:uncharacterized RDD family membrane protein YckC
MYSYGVGPERQEYGGYWPRLPYGGFWRRVIAWGIDGLVIGAVLAAVEGVLLAFLRAAGGGTGPAGVTAAWALAGVIAVWLYYALMESSSLQATVGKLALGMRVTDLNGRRISFERATGRFFAKILSVLTLGIGYLMVAFTPRKRALHDYVAGTLVYRTWAVQAAAGGQPGAPVS